MRNADRFLRGPRGSAWAPRFWLCLVSLLLVIAGTGCEKAGTNALSGLRPSKASDIERPLRLNDGVAALNGDEWDSSLAAVFKKPDASVVFDLGTTRTLRSGWLHADNDDTYAVALSDDETTYKTVWEAKRVKGNGLRPRTGSFEASGRYVRVSATEGDGSYSISEIQLFEAAGVSGPLGLKRGAGRALEEMARTSILHVGLALLAVVFLVRSRSQGPGEKEAMPTYPIGLVALGLAIYGVARIFPDAWPIDPRGVSLVRGTVATVAFFAIGWETFAPSRFAPDKRATTAVLSLCGLLGVLAFYNLGNPQFFDEGAKKQSFVHYLDLRQYHQTAKYFPEIGYRRLYDADVAAYLADTGEPFERVEKIDMRNLDTNFVEKIGQRRAVVEAMPARFTPERWEAYRRDARFFRGVLGKEAWFDTMHDLGGNATPIWIANAYLMFNAFEANDASFFRVALLDVLLILGMFVAIGRTFGLRAAAVSMVLFGCNDFIMYGTNWGGAIFRHDWLVCLGYGICALATQRGVLAGVLFAAAAAFRAFPGLALIGVVFPPLWVLLEIALAKRKLPSLDDVKAAVRPIWPVVMGASAALGLLLIYSLLVLGAPAWRDWAAKIAILNADAHVNTVSLVGLLAGETVRDPVISARRPLVLVCMIGFSLAIFAITRRKPLHQGAVAGLLLLPIVMNPSNYYLHLVCFYPLVVLWPRHALPAVAGDSLTDAAPATEGPSAKDTLRAPIDALFDPVAALVAMILLLMCASQYFAVLVSDRGTHFYLLSATIVAAMGALLFVVLRRDGSGVLEALERRDPLAVPAMVDDAPAPVEEAEISPEAEAKPRKTKKRKKKTDPEDDLGLSEHSDGKRAKPGRIARCAPPTSLSLRPSSPRSPPLPAARTTPQPALRGERREPPRRRVVRGGRPREEKAESQRGAPGERPQEEEAELPPKADRAGSPRGVRGKRPQEEKAELPPKADRAGSPRGVRGARPQEATQAPPEAKRAPPRRVEPPAPAPPAAARRPLPAASPSRPPLPRTRKMKSSPLTTPSAPRNACRPSLGPILLPPRRKPG